MILDALELSVLMPAKNAGKTIRLAVKSALFAMPKRSELLVLLDDCTDGTLDVLSTIKDPRLVVHNPGGKFGISAARNYLLSHAKSEVVAVLDSDDIALPWRFWLQLRSLKKGFDLVANTAWVFGYALKPFPLLPQLPLTLSSEVLPLMLTTSNPIVHSSVVFKKSLAISLGGYPTTWPMEDYNLWLNLAISGAKMRRGGAPVVMYRYHSAQVTQTSARRLDPLILESIKSVIGNLVTELGESSDINKRREKLYKKLPLAKLEHFGLGGINSKPANPHAKASL